MVKESFAESINVCFESLLNVSPCEIVETARIDHQSSNDRETIQDAVSDMGLWSMNMHPFFRDLMVNAGPGQLQNKNGPFYPDEMGRSLNKPWFLRTHKNGEKPRGLGCAIPHCSAIVVRCSHRKVIKVVSAVKLDSQHGEN